ncbi:GntR family transcriptional regulator [Aquirufa echingensis]|uniref:GntR family transcriptional regulator n=1 Tax=Aquirufa echingensis TaxID=3096516 RepID=A0ABW6D0Z3_9BACT
MISLIHIDEFSSTPKYRQLANSIIEGIQAGKIKQGDVLPSINELSFEHYISRITVEKGYNYLKSLGIVESVRGKGFFISVGSVPANFRIFLLFNKLSVHKKMIYDSFVASMGPMAGIDFYIYNNDFNLFKRIITKRELDYSHIVIIPHFMEGDSIAVDFINSLPKEKLILLDKLLPGIQGSYGAVYENFEKDIYQTLLQAKDALAKYHTIQLVFPASSYYPKAIVKGFEHFCRDYAFDFKVSEEAQPEKGTAFITVMEDDLIELLDQIKQQGLSLGKDIGLISYNETPIKRLLFDGISTISTDFVKMGELAADLVKTNARNKIENPFSFIQRSSL